MEDECCARAGHAALFAGFQQERFYRQSGARWAELARTARFVVVFADFGEPAEPGVLSPGEPPPGEPLTVRIPAGAPLRREWFLVCADRDHPAFVAAWEFPGGAGGPDSRRRFEALWSVDPPAVRDAALICARMARALSPGLEPVLAGLPDEAAAPASPDLHRAMGLLTRMTGYLDKRA
jgi:DICT domain-containing protein